MSQKIGFTSNPPPAAVVGGTYTPTATGGASSNPVTFTIDASSHGSCAISGATVTFVAIGTCVIDANQAGNAGYEAGNAGYEAATPVQQSFAVVGTQRITFTSTPPAAAMVGGTYTSTATGGASGNPVTLTIDASAHGACTMAGATVTFVAAGTCVIDGNQAGNAGYEPATQVQQSFTVIGTQRITFTSTPPAPAVVGGTYTPTATGGASGNPVTFTIDATADGSCAIAGATVTFVAAGTCVLDANQAGNAGYLAATQVQQSFDPELAPQNITFTSTPPAAAVVGGSYTPTATGGASGNPVTFTIDATADGSCAIAGATVTFVSVGTCVVDANQAGNAGYLPATQVQQSFDPELAPQNITFTSTPPAAAVVGGTYTPTATGGASGNPVIFTIDASADGVCAMAGATVTFVGVGTCVVDANQAGNAGYEAATQAQQSFDPELPPQSITFTSTPPAAAVVGGSYTSTATGGASGNPVTFTIDASADGICAMAGATVTFVGVGTCVVDANQAGNAGYEAATQVQQSFAVIGTQSITFTSTPPATSVVGGTYTSMATGGASGNPVTLTIDASAHGACAISGATVTFVAAGTCVIDANQAGNAGYEAATQVQQSFAVIGTQSMTFTSTPPATSVVGGTYTSTATGGASGNPVTLTIDASAHGACVISGATVTFVAVGTCVIDANQAGNAGYLAATQVQQSFAIIGTQGITFTSTPPVTAVVGGTYTPTATGGASGNPVIFTIDASAHGACAISGATVTFAGAGTCVVDANQAGNAGYLAAPQVQQTFTLSVTTTTDPTWSCTSSEPIDDPSNGGWVYWENNSCPMAPNTWTDSTHFAGQNDPSDTGGLTDEVGQDVWAPICAQANGDEVPSVGATASAGTSGTDTVTVPTWATASNDVGVEVSDYTNPSRVKTGTTVSAVNTSTGVLTLSANLVSTVKGDEIVVGQGVNDPTCVARQTQVIQANSAQNWQVTANIPTNPSGAVTTYPNAWAHGYGGVLDDYTSLTSTATVSMPVASTVSAHAMQDDWLTGPGDSDGYDYEVMIQYDHENDGTCPSTASASSGTWNYGVTATNVMFNGSPWYLCDGQTTTGRTSSGGCPSTGCGPVVWMPGTPSATRNQSSVSLNLKAMFQWLEDNDPPGESYPYMAPGSSVYALSNGFEISSTGGVPETFSTSSYTITATGAPST